MDHQEFSGWCEVLAARLPDTGAWLAKQSRATQGYWFEALAPYSHEDCACALQEVLNEGFAAYDRERVITQISKRAAAIAFKRSEDQKHQSRQRAGNRGSMAAGIASTLSNAGVGDAFRALLEEQRRRKADGSPMTDEERRAFVDRLLPDDDDPSKQPRVKCLVCQDSGFVSGRDDAGRHQTYGCNCEAGDKRMENFRESGRHLARALERVSFGEYGGN